MPADPGRYFRIPATEYGPAQVKATREGRTMTWIVRHALRLYVAGLLPLEPVPGTIEDDAGEDGT